MPEDQDKSLINQIEEEYKVSYDFMQSKRNEWLRRLKLYNNQGREPSKVGDPLLFTVFQTIFSALYDDRMQVEFEPNSRGDEEHTENLNDLAEHDYRVMNKDELDHDWIWDTCFFGRGLLLLDEFDRDETIMAPVAETIDPLMWMRDPRASSVNGDMRGRGAMRFGGREINLTKSEMESIPGFKNLDKLKKGKTERNITEEVRQERRAAQGTDFIKEKEDSLTENFEYHLLEWFTIVDGKKKVITLGNDRKLVIRERDIKGNRWPIIDRSLFPIAHDWDGVSVPDLIEDKQRARAKMINLGLDAAIADLHPMYLYNKKVIRNKRDLDFAFNKAVGVDGAVRDAYLPMQKANTATVQAQSILNILDIAAQKATSSPEIAQGVQPKVERTLGESQLIAAARGARMSLAAAIFGWSEKNFWRQWYFLYKQYFKDEIDEKVIRIKGALAPKWRTLTRENIITFVDPDVRVESVKISEAKRQREMAEFGRFFEIAVQDPQTNRRFLQRRMGRILRLKKEDLDIAFPPTPHELIAEDENTRLNNNKFVPINHFDDHIQHIEIHARANKTGATVAHIEAHKMMMKAMMEQGMQLPQTQQGELQVTTPPTPGMEPEAPAGRGEGQQQALAGFR